MMKNKGFTLFEVMIAIFVFSSGMMAFMAYHAKANSMMFDNESSQIAHALALNLAEEINSMTPERFFLLTENGSIVMGAYTFDSLISQYIDSLRDAGGNPVNVSPFDSFGKPGASTTAQYNYYRLIKINTYDAETDTFNPDPSLYGKLRQVDVIVSWPFKGKGNIQCNAIDKFDSCNYLTIPVVKFMEPTT